MFASWGFSLFPVSFVDVCYCWYFAVFCFQKTICIYAITQFHWLSSGALKLKRNKKYLIFVYIKWVYFKFMNFVDHSFYFGIYSVTIWMRQNELPYVNPQRHVSFDSYAIAMAHLSTKRKNEIFYWFSVLLQCWFSWH